ncbi:hypothetical protein ILUMI_26014 [Ignelater luminosus]|uniref:Scavenger receptor class B member 1 n=1 Tax=Ignelater luminosus TaxID=2038154 RepID=A0A8K0C7B9_IGNLU|nr:hypothetical protein ILUMI_26014 [Ignelater luminosus]
MSKIYPNLEYLSERENEHHRSTSDLETNCGQIFSKSSAFTRDIIEKLEETEIGPKNTVICGHEFRTRQLWVLTGLILLFLSSCMGMGLMFGTTMFDGYVLSNIVLANNTNAYNLWKGPFMRSVLKVYIFNYTNVDEYERGEAEKLHVKEVGPFVYEEISERVNVQFYPNGTVSYQEHRRHKYRADLSKGRRQSDRIIVPNMPMLGAAAISKNSYYMTRLAMSTLLKGLNAKPFLNLPAHRFIWGYDDSLYALAKGVMSYQKKFPFEKFGILASRNGTSSDVITINTGKKDINKLGLIDRFNGEESIDHWSTDDCNKIQGGDGTIFPPHVVRQKKPIYMYQKELCRRLPLVFDKEVKIINGKISAYKYVLPDTVFDRPEIDPENQCYCDMDSGNCSPQGVFNATPCAYGAPAFISFPHFYNADPALKEAVSGLNPNPQHDNFLYVHPRLGFTMAGKSQLQMNVQVRKSFGMTQLDMFEDDMILPITWVEIGLEDKDLPDLAKEGIYGASFTIPAIEMSLQYGCLLTALVTLTAIAIILKGKWNERIQRIRRLQRNTSTQSGNRLIS